MEGARPDDGTPDCELPGSHAFPSGPSGGTHTADRYRDWLGEWAMGLLIGAGGGVLLVMALLAVIQLQQFQREESEAVRLARYTINRLLPEPPAVPTGSVASANTQSFRPGEMVAEEEQPFALSVLTGTHHHGQ